MGESHYSTPEGNAEIEDEKRKKIFYSITDDKGNLLYYSSNPDGDPYVIHSLIYQLEEIDNVKNVEILENCTDHVDEDGRPPHSIQAIVTGGKAKEIAQRIFDIKPAGIATFGQVSLPFATPIGLYHIQFDRSYKLKLYERLAFYLYRKYVKLTWRITNIF